jgi:23S rRNA pseudouridine1911/1915/1917 synthase
MINVKTLFEDEWLLIQDKPSGVTVNRSDTTTGEETLQDFVQEKIKDILRGTAAEEKEFLDRAGMVHRIDKETSGILVVAKDPETFRVMQALFKEREIEKTYTTLVHGKLAPKEGEIKAPVGRLPWNRKRFGVLAGGREANTFYKSLKEFQKNDQDLSLLEVSPKTGRTHQIRVHLKYIGHPVFSDALYAGRKTARQDRLALPRLFLHASKISFIHPKTSLALEVESPLPIELETFLS